MPVPLVASADGLIPHVVDEIAFQTRRNLAQRALIDVMPFRREDRRRSWQARAASPKAAPTRSRCRRDSWSAPRAMP
jgi:hypothetical protein